MTLLREAVGWRGYGQRNPLYEYKQDAFYMFETRKEVLRHLVIYDLLRSSFYKPKFILINLYYVKTYTF
jgi:preprotein translocase subunit SecA